VGEVERRNLIADTALEYLGCNEADGSHREIIDRYNSIHPLPRGYKMSYSDPWCAAFIGAIAAECGMTDILLPECSCDAMIELYRKRGLWMEADDYTPKVGDLVLYDWQDSGSGDNTGSSDHIGIVYARDGNNLTIVEGNISDSVDFRQIKVNGRYIRGYCLPDYAGIASENPKKSDTVVIEQISVRTLKNGMAGLDVLAMQALLELHGCSTGPDGPDGDFGSNTDKALRKFQNEKNLEADGLCGRITWRALLGI
jgi:hypothetical protein